MIRALWSTPGGRGAVVRSSMLFVPLAVLTALYDCSQVHPVLVVYDLALGLVASLVALTLAGRRPRLARVRELVRRR